MKVKIFFLILLLCSCSLLIPTKRVRYAGWSIESSPEDKVIWTKIGTFNSEDDVITFAEKKRLSLISLLNPKLDPYTGDLLGLDKCLLKNLPSEVREDSKERYMLTLFLYSSDVNALGQCYDEEQLLKTNYTILYCKESKDLFTIRHFYKKNSKWVNPLETLCN